MVRALLFAPNGLTLASAGNDQAVRIFEVSTGKLLRTFRGHAAAVQALAFSPDGKSLASGSADTTALVWRAGE